MKKLITILILLVAVNAYGLDIKRTLVDTYDINHTFYATKTSIHTFTAANWNEDGATWTMGTSGPLVHVTGNTTTVTATNSEAIVAGTTYKVTITGTGGGATATYTLGGVTGTTIAATGAIAITDYITATSTASLIITPSSTCTVSISAITIEKLTGATGDFVAEGTLTTRRQFLGSPTALGSTGTYPVYSFFNDTDTGMTRNSSADTLDFITGGVARLRIDTTNVKVGTNLVFNTSNGDVILSRDAAQTLQIGIDAATATTPQTIKSADSTGAGQAGADLTLKGGTGGTGGLAGNVNLVGNSVSMQTAANSQALNVKTLTELTTIAAAASTNTTIQIPANVIVLAVSVRVTIVIPTAETFTVTGTSSSTAFQTGAGVSTAATTTDVGTKACPYLNTAAQTITITPNTSPADNTGRVRVTIHYIDITPAAS